VKVVSYSNTKVTLSLLSLKSHPEKGHYKDEECKETLDATKTFEENGLKAGDLVYQNKSLPTGKTISDLKHVAQ